MQLLKGNRGDESKFRISYESKSLVDLPVSSFHVFRIKTPFISDQFTAIPLPFCLGRSIHHRFAFYQHYSVINSTHSNENRDILITEHTEMTREWPDVKKERKKFDDGSVDDKIIRMWNGFVRMGELWVRKE